MVAAAPTRSWTQPQAAAAEPAVAWSSLNASSVSALNATAFVHVTATQLAALSADACAGLQTAQLAVVATAVGTLNASSGLSAACIAATPSAALRQVSTDFVRWLNGSAVGALSGPQVAALPSATFVAFQAAQLTYLHPQACTGLTDDQVRQIGDKQPHGPKHSSKTCEVHSVL